MSFKKNISDKLGLSGGPIADAIKQNTQYINAELKVVKIAQGAINALKTYADAETPKLKASVSALTRKLENIEKAREQKANELQQKFIELLNKIVEEEKFKNEKVKEANATESAFIKAENKLAKLEEKPVEKQNPERIDEAKSVLNEAKGTNQKAQTTAKATEDAFNKKRLELVQSILKNIAEIEKKFHDNALKQIGAQKAETIEV